MNTSVRTDAAPARAAAGLDDLARVLDDPRRSAWVAYRDGAWSVHEEPTLGAGFLPAVAPEALGDADFRVEHGVRFAYVAGAMANGIASEDLVEALARAGMLAFFGSAGLDVGRVRSALDRLASTLGPDAPWGVNLIHSPAEPALEDALVDLYLEREVPCVEASAFMGLTPAVVRWRAKGMTRRADGTVDAPHRVVAKVSRVEVATRFLSPPPEALLRDLVAAGRLTADEAECAATLPVATDLTAEADSGGHTDNRPLVAMLPTMTALRDRLRREHGYAVLPRIGAAGGIGTPAAAAAGFALGAGYVVGGSIHQACIESGSSDAVRAMLAEAQQADVVMAPAADMFEMGVQVQVLKRGTMFAMRARRLYELYVAHPSLEALPAKDRATLETQWFQRPLEDVWAETRAFFATRDPAQVARAEAEPKHRMALVFRWYLGLSSRWANDGVPDRRLDYQVWCGPAMGAFNEWARGSFLEDAAERRVAVVARNLMEGAARLVRAQALRAQGVPVPTDAVRATPRRVDELDAVDSGAGDGRNDGERGA